LRVLTGFRGYPAACPALACRSPRWNAAPRPLLEVYADGQTADVALLEPAARALVLHCLYGGVPSDLSRSRAISAAARADTFA
jgi:hypothetical protein